MQIQVSKEHRESEKLKQCQHDREKVEPEPVKHDPPNFKLRLVLRLVTFFLLFLRAIEGNKCRQRHAKQNKGVHQQQNQNDDDHHRPLVIGNHFSVYVHS